ncbi:MAG: VWA domain-containing protein, partial [Gammaproteobacteria bacterium]|nr:VWA domain-containing protein [Gammaproteobacteria bacterium]
MRLSRTLSTALALLVGLAAAAPVQVHADDTEVYLLSPSQGAKPNILFILDTSGSMSAYDGFNKDRLDRMKEAFNTILSETTNVNIGLMRFTDPGGPILFPVRNIDGPAFALEGNELLVSTVTPITDGADDAEELLGVSGTNCSNPSAFCNVQLDSFYLDIGQTKAFGREMLRTYGATDDALSDYYDWLDMQVYLNYNFGSIGMEMTAQDLAAMRFQNFPSISTSGLSTQNATVTFAQLDLYATTTESAATEFKIFGARADDFDPLPVSNQPFTWLNPWYRTGGVLFSYPGFIQAEAFECDANNPMRLVGNEANDIQCRITANPALYDKDNALRNSATDARNYYTNGYNAVRYDTIDSTWTVSDGNNGHLTDAFVTWNVPPTLTGNRFQTPNLAPLIQEVFSTPGWQGGSGKDDLGLFIIAKGPGKRAFGIEEQGSSREPQLTAAWVENTANTKSGEVLVGLRFRNVLVPQGATLTKASLELYPNGRYYSAAEVSGNAFAADSPINIVVNAETNLSGGGGAPAFQRLDDHLSSRRTSNSTTASASYSFATSANWELGSPVILGGAAFENVVREVTDSSDWCGGKSMVLFLKVDGAANAARLVHSFDVEPSLAPALNIEYDPTDLAPGEGCIQERIVAQVNTSRGDSEENSSRGRNTYTSDVLDLRGYNNGHDALVGLQFTDIQLPKDSRIIDARIQFTSDENFDGSSCTEVDVRAELTGNPSPFSSSRNDLGNRASSASSAVRIKMAGGDNLARDEKFSTVETADDDCNPEADDVVTKDLTSLVQQIVDSSSWDVGKTMSFILERVSGEVYPKSYDNSPTNAPQLYITAEVLKGSVPDPEERSATVREVLRDIVDDLNHDGFTPIVDTLYEAYLYYAGEPVYYGRTRGYWAGSNSSSVQRSTRVSHQLSYTGGTLDRPSGCTEENLNSNDCRQEKIDATPTAPVYLSPIKDVCGEQSNYIVLLTDGLANSPHSQDEIKAIERADNTTINSCRTSYTNDSNQNRSVSSGERCGFELARHLATEDLAPSVQGQNSVIMHTVGFAIEPGGEDFLQQLVKPGGGSYVEARSAEELTDQFRRFIQEAKDKPTTSFAAPAVSVNAFNKLFTDKDVYFSYFEPNPTASWFGNVKKYRICTFDLVSSEGCVLGELLDTYLDPILERDPTRRDQLRVKSDTLSFWSQGQADLVVDQNDLGKNYDGGRISIGGAGGKLRGTDPDNRRVFTVLDTSVPTTYSYYASDANPGRTLDEFKLTSTTPSGVLDGITDPDPAQTTKDLLDMGTATASEVDELVHWIRGANVDNVQLETDSSVKSTRYAFHDPLHTSPVAITYGKGTDASETPIVKILISTNGGAIRMINGETGDEEWVFYPQSMLPKQKLLRENAAGAKVYGLDGAIRTWINDVNQDGTIDASAGDFVRLYVGMRRGGSYYYALDITPATVLTDATALDGITPKLMWRVHGGGSDGVYARLGQTWSPPQLDDVLLGTALAGQTLRRKAMIVGGGYEDGQDDAWGPVSGTGNAVYVIDAATGERLFFASDVGVTTGGHASSTSNDGLVFSGLDCAIPSRIGALDMNRDGAVDRMYFGDNCANMHRIDLFPNLDENVTGMRGVIGTLASLGADAPAADPDDRRDQRKIQYSPDIIPVRGALAYNTGGGDYDLIVTVTGDRADPLDENVANFAYGLRDYHTAALQDTDSDGVANNYPSGGLIQGMLLTDATVLSNLFDVTEIQLPIGPEVPNPAFDLLNLTSTEAQQLEDLRTSKGWMIELGRSINGIDGSFRPGEKGLSSPLILGGRLFFTTFVPGGVDPTLFGLQADNSASSQDACATADGAGLIYALDALTGAAVINWGDAGGDNNDGPPGGVGKRWQLVTPDPPPEPVPLF